MALDFSGLDQISRLSRADAAELLTAVPVDAIDPDPTQPRRTFDAALLAELAASITEHGLLQPIVVRSVADRYVLVAGERRWRAVRQLRRSTINAIVRNDVSARAALVENVQRENLSASEISAWIGSQIEAGLSQTDLAREIGKSRAWVHAYASVSKMPACFGDALRDLRVSDITALVQLHALHKDAPGRVETFLATSASITRQSVATLGRELGDVPLAMSSPVTETSHIVPRTADRSRAGRSVVEPVATAEPVRIHVIHDGQPFRVCYRDQRGEPGQREVLIEGESGQRFYVRISELRLHSIG